MAANGHTVPSARRLSVLISLLSARNDSPLKEANYSASAAKPSHGLRGAPAADPAGQLRT